MGNSSSSPDSPKAALERGCGWVMDSDRAACFHCETTFSFFSTRRHHCRLCGEVFCDDSQCWGTKVMLPPSLFVEADPLSPSNRVSAQNAGLPFLTAPQSVCRVCADVLIGPMRKIALTLQESAISRALSANRAQWADPSYRANIADEFVTHITVVSVGHKDDDLKRMFNVNRTYRLHLDSWRPFNKQTRLFFCAVDPIGPDDDPNSPDAPTPRSRSGSTASNSGGGGAAAATAGGSPRSAMQRTRRKSRTDLVIDVPVKAEESTMTLPNRWTLGGTAIFNCEVVRTPVEGIRLETFSDIIVLSPDLTVAPHFTLPSHELYQVIKQAVDHSRVRGKVRLSSVKPSGSKFQKRSKS
jgi:hypothetical protein